MRLDFRQERVLAVVAHPDDAELLCAGTLARASGDGAAVAICVLCQGDKGQPDPPINELAAVRRGEAESAAALLGAELYFGGIHDGTLSRSDEALPALIDVFRRFRPTLVLAHAAEDYHPDHRAASFLAEAASWQCASRGLVTAEPATAAHPALWWMDTVAMHVFLPGFYVDVSDYFELKERMLACHLSQLQRGMDEDFTPLLDLMRLQSAARGRQAGVRAAEAFRIHNAFQRAHAW